MTEKITIEELDEGYTLEQQDGMSLNKWARETTNGILEDVLDWLEYPSEQIYSILSLVANNPDQSWLETKDSE